MTYVDTPVEAIFRGPAQNAKVHNDTYGENFGVSGLINLGEEARVYTAPGRKSASMGEVNIMSRVATGTAVLWSLRPGLNLIRYTDSNDGSVELRWHPLHSSV
jgi:hypothetical protein